MKNTNDDDDDIQKKVEYSEIFQIKVKKNK